MQIKLLLEAHWLMGKCPRTQTKTSVASFSDQMDFRIKVILFLAADLRTALVERSDFSSGTSSRSTKLIHGGVRYLQKAIMQLDYEQVAPPPLLHPHLPPLSSPASPSLSVSMVTVHDGERGPARASQPPGDRASPVRPATHHASCLQVSVSARGMTVPSL